jgi:hypothetical protein
MKKWYQSKTIWVAIVTALVGVGTSLVASETLPTSITASIVTALGVLNFVLRTLTDTRIAN